jgi:hypothetical protein
MKKSILLSLFSFLYFSVFAQMLPIDNGKTYQNAKFLKKTPLSSTTVVPVWNVGKNEWESVVGASFAAQNGGENVFYINRKYTGAIGSASHQLQLSSAVIGNSMLPFPDPFSVRKFIAAWLVANPTKRAVAYVMEGNKFTLGTDSGVDFTVTPAAAVKNYPFRSGLSSASYDTLSQDLATNRLDWYFAANSEVEYRGSGVQIGGNPIYPALFMTKSNWKASGSSPFFTFDSDRTNDTFSIGGHLRFVDTINFSVANIYNNMGFLVVGSDSSVVDVEINALLSNTMYLNVFRGSVSFTCETYRTGVNFGFTIEADPIVLGGFLKDMPNTSLKNYSINIANFYSGDGTYDGKNVYRARSGNGAVNYKRSPLTFANIKNANLSVNIGSLISEGAGKTLSMAKCENSNVAIKIDNYLSYRNSDDLLVDDGGIESQALPDFQARDTLINSTLSLDIGFSKSDKSILLVSSLSAVNFQCLLTVGKARKIFNSAATKTPTSVNYLSLVDVNNFWADTSSSIVIRGNYEADSCPVVRVKSATNVTSIIFTGSFKTRSSRYPAFLVESGGSREAKGVIKLNNCRLFSNFTSSFFVDAGSSTVTDIETNGVIMNKNILGNVFVLGQTPFLSSSLNY